MAKKNIGAMKKYEEAFVAMQVPEGLNDLKLSAMSALYEGFGVPQGDPVITKLLQESVYGIQNGGDMHTDLVKAMNMYANKYQENFEESTVSEVIDYLGDNDIPEALAKIISKHAETPYQKLDKKDKEQKKIIGAIEMLRERWFRANKLSKMLKKTTESNIKAGLESLVAD